MIDSSEGFTCQSNDSAGSIGTSTEHYVDLESEISRVPQEVYVSKPITTNEKGVSALKSKERNRGKVTLLTKRYVFVCGSLSHLIKDCDYYEKKMAREAAPKKQRVFNTGNGVTKPVWNNADRINHANHFVPRSVILNSGRPNVNTVRTNINSVRQNVNSVWSNVNTGSFNVNSVRPKQPVPTSTSPNFSSERPQVNKFNQRSNFSKSHSSVRRPFAKNTAQMSHSHAVKGNWGSAVKTSAGPQGRPKPVQAWVTRINWRILKNSMKDLDPLVSLVQELVTPSKTVNASGEEQVEDISPTTLEAAAILTKVQKIKSVDKGKRYKRRKSSKAFAGTGLDFEEVKSAFEKVNTGGRRVSVPSPDRGRREGKAPMTEEEETQASRKTKEQILQEEAGLAEAIRLDALEKALEKEEVAKQVHLDSLIAQRMAEEQELIRDKKENGRLHESRDMEVDSIEEVKAEFEKLVKQLDTYVPMNFEATKESLKRFGEELQTKTAKKLKFDDEGTQPTEEKIEEDKDDKPTKKTGKRRKQIARKGFHTDHDKDESEDSDEANEKDDSTSGTNIIFNLFCSYKIPSYSRYKTHSAGRKGVYQNCKENGTVMDCHEEYMGLKSQRMNLKKVLWEYLKNCFEEPLSTDSIWSLPGQQDVYMLIERKYPLSAEVCKAMLDKKLQGGKPDEDCYKLLKMMEKQAGIRK
ncbi:hypothetical protein Tco_0247761 [Tanacetum coccineum]